MLQGIPYGPHYTLVPARIAPPPPPLHVYTYLTIWTTLQVVKTLTSPILAASGPSCMTPVISHTSLEPGLAYKAFLSSLKEKKLRAHNFWSDDHYHSFSDIQNIFDPLLPLWKNMQLRHFKSHNWVKVRSLATLTSFVRVCLSEDLVTHALSQSYCMLTHPVNLPPLKYMVQWKQDLQTTFAEQQQERNI